MARTPAKAATPEARFIASRILDARRRGATNVEIGRAFGINERTVRKLVAGETSGTRTFKRKMVTKRKASSQNAFRADVELAPGMVRSVPVLIPDLPTARGRGAPTPFDIFRLPSLRSIAIVEARKMARRYGVSSANLRLLGIRKSARSQAKLIRVRGRVG